MVKAPILGPASSTGRVLVGATNNDPELVETVPITRAGAPKQWTVVMRLSEKTKTETPLPDLAPGDKLVVYVELEVTTDAASASNPGLIGHPYSYAPRVEARFLLAGDPTAVAPAPGKAISIAPAAYSECSQQRHHLVLRLGGAGFVIPRSGLGWKTANAINVALSASHPQARSGDRLLIGENEPTKIVDQDIAGIRVVRFRPGSQAARTPLRQSKPLVRSIAVAKKPTVVYSQALRGLRRDEQLLVHGRLLTDAADVGYPARVSTRLILADSPTATDPGATAQAVASWKGNLSKENGFNCLVGEGPMPSDKYGVLKMLQASPRELYLNMTATSSAPFEASSTPGDPLPIHGGGFLDVSRFPADCCG